MKRKTIRNHRDFITPKDAIIVFMGRLFFIKIKPAKIPDDARYGLVASKKLFRFAVQRNRAKRLLRDWIAYNEDLMLPELDYVFIASRDILNTSRENGRKAMKQGLRRISKKYNETKK